MDWATRGARRLRELGALLFEERKIFITEHERCGGTAEAFIWLTIICRLWRNFRFQAGSTGRTPQGRPYRRTQYLRWQVGSHVLLPPIILRGNRLLLHTETQDGSVVPIWEDARPVNISVMKERMASRKHLAEGVELVYARIPITAEKVPDFGDLSELMDVVIRTHASETPIVLNCQLGRGRSTLTSVSYPSSLWSGLGIDDRIHSSTDHPCFDTELAE